ncbi:MAG: hypothetical protein WC632_00575 [Candidatus Margulisiibacteriota bacterium]
MKNSECVINFITSGGKVQSWRKKKAHWEQTSSRGIVRKATAEQVLSHLLPYLAIKNKKRYVTLEVKRIKAKGSTKKKGK